MREQLALLEARKQQYQRAALQAKRGQDLEQAKAHLRVAKYLEAQITQVRAGRHVDLSKVSLTSLSSRTSQAEHWQASQAGLGMKQLLGGGGMQLGYGGSLERACSLCQSTPWPRERPGKARWAACGQR